MAELEVEDQNLTIVDNVSNASNLTGREAATPEGIAVTYFSLFLMALGPILVGSLRSVKHHLSLKVVAFAGVVVLIVWSILSSHGVWIWTFLNKYVGHSMYHL